MTTPEPTNEPTPETHADAPPTVDPAIAALFRPPFTPQSLTLHLDVRVDADGIWCQVPELPGLFATGATIPELGTSLGEAVERYLIDHTRIVESTTDDAVATDETGE